MAEASAWLDVDWSRHRRAVELDGGEVVHYVDYGRGRGPVILLVHGLGGRWQAWLENLPDLGRTCRVIAVDLPGFGDSPLIAGTVTPTEYAEVLSQVCDALGLVEVVAIGNSFGGWVSAELAMLRPDLVTGLVLVAAAGIVPTRAERLKVVSLLRLTDRVAPIGCRYRDQVIQRPRLRRRALAFMFADPVALSEEIVAELLPSEPDAAFRMVLRESVLSWSPAFAPRLRDVVCPALVIWGEADAQLPLRHATEWQRLLPGSDLVLIPAAGHLPMIEAPQAFLAAVSPFLARVGARPQRRRRAARGEPVHPA